MLLLRPGEARGRSSLEEALQAAEIPIHSISMGGLRDLRSGLAFISLLRRIRAEVVHAHNRPSDIWAMLWSAGAGTRCRLYTRHLTYPDLNPGMQRRYRLAARVAGRVVAVSSTVAGHLVREERTPPEKITMIPNGVDLLRFDPVANPRGDGRPDVRSSWGISPEAPVIGTVSRLTHQKGIDVFLESAAGVLREIPEARFVIAGEGEAREALTAKARTLGIAEAVHFPGFQDAADVLCAIDIFLTTSRYEGLPLTLLEAMAAGRAIVAPRIGAFPEIVEDCVTGLLPAPAAWAPHVSHLDPVPFATAVIRLLRDRTLRSRLGESARKRVERDLGVETMVMRNEALYARLLEEGRAA
jgi:glycosyltransferase involved in cell wall biosynthesis